jgi:flagellar biosynthesis protein FlhG
MEFFGDIGTGVNTSAGNPTSFFPGSMSKFPRERFAGDTPFRVVAVTGGKGGIGKTTVSVNLAVALAREGLKVVLVDGDLCLANADLLLGETPEWTVESLLDGSRPLEDVLLETRYGFSLLPGASGSTDLASLGSHQREHLMAQLKLLEAQFDLMIVDTPAGLGPNALFLTALADRPLVVLTPEPTSLVDAYATIKTLQRRYGFESCDVLVNRAPSKSQGRRQFDRLYEVVSKFIDIELRHVGTIPQDERVFRSIISQKPLLLTYPNAPASVAMKSLAQQVAMTRPGDTITERIRGLWQRLFRGRPDAHDEDVSSLSAEGLSDELEGMAEDGWYKSPAKSHLPFERYDSPLERDAMAWLDSDPEVRWWTKEHHIAIPVVDMEGQTKTYRPNFLVQCHDGRRFLVRLLESGLHDLSSFSAEMDVAESWCDAHGLLHMVTDGVPARFGRNHALVGPDTRRDASAA